MKTLFVFNHPAPYKVHVYNELARIAEIQVIFERIKAKDRPDSFYNANQYNFPVFFMKHGSFGNENTFSSELRRYIKKHHSEYDVIVMNGYSTIAEMKAIKYMIKHNIPYVLQINGGVIRKDKAWKKKLKTYFISHASHYLSPCEEADKYLVYYGAKKENIFHYPYGNYFENEIIKELPKAEEIKSIRDKYNLPEGKIYVNASQFIERKNNMQLISIFKDRKESLLLIGSGHEKEKYEKYISENNIKNVKLMDFLPKKELFQVLKACDYFITLSGEDIFGHTTLEAMANGLPVISSNRVVSSLDIIDNGLNGFIVDLNNETQINEAIDKVDSSMKMNALKTAHNNTIEKTAARLKEVLESIKK